jgi:hypothetical protein
MDDFDESRSVQNRTESVRRPYDPEFLHPIPQHVCVDVQYFRTAARAGEQPVGHCRRIVRMWSHSTASWLDIGDAEVIGVVRALGLEDGVESFEDSGLPVGEEVGLDVVLAAEFGLAGFAAQQLQNDLSFELGGEGSTRTRHDKDSWPGPVKYRLLVQRQGRTSHVMICPNHQYLASHTATAR